MANAQPGNQKEKELEVREKEPRIRRWPIIPLVGGPIGILILLCYVTTTKPPEPVEPDKFAGVDESKLLREVEELKSQADQLYQSAESEEDPQKKNALCDKALELCWEAQRKYDTIREAYEDQEKRGLLKEGKTYQWEQSNEELNELIGRIKFIKGF